MMGIHSSDHNYRLKRAGQGLNLMCAMCNFSEDSKILQNRDEQGKKGRAIIGCPCNLPSLNFFEKWQVQCAAGWPTV